MMDGFVSILCGIGVFVFLCCFCSLLQAWRKASKEANFDELYSKYSKENLKKIKSTKKKTAKEIMMLKEEIKIAEERLLAEHKYEKRIRERLKEKDKYQGIRRRKKIEKIRKRRKINDYNYDTNDSDSDSDLENLLEERENHKTDIEKGEEINYIPKRNLQHSYKDEEDSLIERAYDWWKGKPQIKEKLSDVSDQNEEESPSIKNSIKLKPSMKNRFNKLSQLKNPLSHRITLPTFPTMSWQGYHKKRNKNKKNNNGNHNPSLPADSKYIQDMPPEDGNYAYDLSCYQPNSSKSTSKEMSSEITQKNEIKSKNNHVVKIQVDTQQRNKPKRIITKVEDIFSPTTSAQAWGSPLSQESNTSIDLPFLSPQAVNDFQSPLSKPSYVKLTPLKTPPVLNIKNKKSKLFSDSDTDTFSPSPKFQTFNDTHFTGMAQILDDGGLLYSTKNVDIFKPNSALNDADDELSDL